MNEKVIEKLEYNKILELLSERAASEEAKMLCMETLPMRSKADLERRLMRVSDALDRIFKDGAISFGGIRNVRGSVLSTQREATLTPRELMDIASTLETIDTIKAYGMKERFEENPDSLCDDFDCLIPLTDTVKEIRRCILSEDEIADDASGKLKSIRRGIRNAQDRIRSELSSMVQGAYGLDG